MAFYIVLKMENPFATYLILLSNLILLEAQSTVPWYENLPAVAMDYKVHIDPGKEDCYFQYVNPGATFYVSFQVSSSLGSCFYHMLSLLVKLLLKILN